MSEWDLYNKTAERLWEKLQFYVDSIDIYNYNSIPKTFPIDRMTQSNPWTQDLIDEVQQEFNYEMSEFQCSWAVQMFLHNDMEEYNINTGENLTPRK